MKPTRHTKPFTWLVFDLIAQYIVYSIDDCDVVDITFTDGSSIWDYFTDRRCEEVHDYFISMMEKEGRKSE